MSDADLEARLEHMETSTPKGEEIADLGRWEGLIRFMVAKGYARDEIEDEFDRTARMGRRGQFFQFTEAGEFVDWSALRGRRKVQELMDEILGTAAQRPPGWRPTGPEWTEIVIAYRKTGMDRPKLGDVAGRMGFQSEQPVRDRIHKLGIKDWHAVHALVAAEPDPG